MHELARAEKRPSDTAFEPGNHVTASGVKRGILANVPSRLTFPLLIPRRSTFRAVVALAEPASGGVRFRVGMSDDRRFEPLSQITLDATADGGRSAELSADLSAYAGWKWSVFYQPDRWIWRLVLSTDALSAVPTQAIWSEPRIEARVADAHEYTRRVMARRARERQ